ncbi:hypothetical protein [Streptomyces sp. TLI_185]|uniref:hypothetical protein n=1 Tax=Streptomyces sp. TLI_185 TaxID=2485151 RepID=UPI000F507807|nr:hypothetical protein [Streptomyces sp. TLI_185]RPF38005.1 hypothetical protein EDD92_8111 [Streptomyces sp. TLI_185]
MTPGDQSAEEAGGTDRSAGQSQAQVALAPAPTAPDADTGTKAAAQTGAVWDQPLPWAAPQDEGKDESTAEPTSAQPEEPAAPANPSAQPAGEDTKADTEAPDEGSSVALWQAAVAEQQRGAHAAPVPTGAVAGHAVSKWLLGVAVAAGALLAAVGVTEGLGSHPSTATAKEKPEPILGPGKGLDEAGTPTQTPTTPAKGRLAAGAGKAAAAAPPAVGLAAADAQNGHTPTPGHTAAVSPQKAAVKSSTAGQSSYLSVRTSVTSSNDYWSQSNVSVTTTKKLSALKVVLHVAQTGGVANTGVWTSLGDKVTVHTGRASDGGVDYVVTLDAGITLDPGTYVFEFQYNHDKGTRDTSHDIWAVVTTAVGDSKEVSQNGRY